jgi:hypothetical protein
MNSSGLAAIFVPLMFAIIGAAFFAYLTAARHSKAIAAGGPAYQKLAEEYRRLSDLAITSSEHVDLRLSELAVQVDELRGQFVVQVHELRGQLDQMQRILKEVE